VEDADGEGSARCGCEAMNKLGGGGSRYIALQDVPLASVDYHCSSVVEALAADATILAAVAAARGTLPSGYK
jgi:hypothetical protein